MTFNLSDTMSMIKARQHKYTHRKMVGRDPKTNRIRYRYYYAEHHGGGITSANIEEGSAFKLTYKGRRGHFHVQRVEGDKVYVKHDGRPNAKEVEMTKGELRALLKRQHETIENKKREKAQANRRKGRKSAAKKRKETQTQTSREQLTETAQQGADNFETMPEVEASLDVKRQRLERLKRMYTPSKKKEITPDKYVISFAHRSGGKDHYLISIGDPRKQGSKTVGIVQYKEGVQDWLSDNKNVNISENNIIDVSGLNLVSDEHTDDFMKMQAGIKKDIDRLQDEINQSEAETPQQSQTAQAFSGLVDAIKSGEGTQAAQRAFKVELDKVLDKTESGTLTDAERAELLPIAEQLVEATTGGPRALMTAVRDQIKGSRP